MSRRLLFFQLFQLILITIMLKNAIARIQHFSDHRSELRSSHEKVTEIHAVLFHMWKEC